MWLGNNPVEWLVLYFRVRAGSEVKGGLCTTFSVLQRAAVYRVLECHLRRILCFTWAFESEFKPAQVVMLGSGSAMYENAMRQAEAQHKTHFRCAVVHPMHAQESKHGAFFCFSSQL